MKILFLDIETSPNTAHVWGLWKNTVSINQLLESSYVMCWAAKWSGSKTTMFSSIHQDGQESMLHQIHVLLDDADVVVHYNGKKFDIPTLNKEFLLMGLAPPSPYKQIDVLEVVRNSFRFPSNKLDYIAQRLNLGQKHHHEGHTLWIKCMNNDKKAWEVMKKYNMADVTLLEKVYTEVLPWIKNHPNRATYEESYSPHSCPNCGSTHVEKRGFSHTVATKWQRYQCNNCGTWSKGSIAKAIKGILKSA